MRCDVGCKCRRIQNANCNYEGMSHGCDVAVLSRGVVELCCLKNCVHLGCYAASSGNPLTTFRCSLSVPSRRFGTGCRSHPNVSVRNYFYSLRKYPEEGISRLLLGGSLKSRFAGFRDEGLSPTFRDNLSIPYAKNFLFEHPDPGRAKSLGMWSVY